jgi:hypothetical protein
MYFKAFGIVSIEGVPDTGWGRSKPGLMSRTDRLYKT